MRQKNYNKFEDRLAIILQHPLLKNRRKNEWKGAGILEKSLHLYLWFHFPMTWTIKMQNCRSK